MWKNYYIRGKYCNRNLLCIVIIGIHRPQLDNAIEELKKYYRRGDDKLTISTYYFNFNPRYDPYHRLFDPSTILRYSN
jgi:hypothetical protein